MGNIKFYGEVVTTLPDRLFRVTAGKRDLSWQAELGFFGALIPLLFFLLFSESPDECTFAV